MATSAPTLTLDKISAESLRVWFERDSRRKELEREARQLESANKLFEGQVLLALTVEERTSFRRGDFAVQVVDGSPRVSWKDEFLRLAGPDAAAELVKSADTPKKLQISKA